MESESTPIVAAAKLPEVILNGDSPPPTRTIDGVEKVYPPTTTKENLARKNEFKARGLVALDLGLQGVVGVEFMKKRSGNWLILLPRDTVLLVIINIGALLMLKSVTKRYGRKEHFILPIQVSTAHVDVSTAKVKHYYC
ncbi:hypothetical protein Tco_0664277 [Tanacetum coccineum]